MDDRGLLSWALEDLRYRAKSLKKVNVKGWEFYEDENRALAPYFTNELMKRIHQKKACNIIVVGEAGIWKSYCAIQIARIIYPRFKIRQVVYRYSEYYEVLMDRKLKAGSPIVLDEPQDAIDHRDWYKEVQKALIKTITSQRFMVKPLIVPIINPSLLDKTIRDYLVQFQLECTDRGKARVFRLSPSLKEDKTYYMHLCNLEYGLMDNDLCARDSCLDCRDLDSCQIFRAQYERKKLETQFIKYEQEKQQVLVREGKQLTNEQIMEVAITLREHYADSDGFIDAKKLRLMLRQPPHHIVIGYNKSYDLKTLLEYRYPQHFKSK